MDTWIHSLPRVVSVARNDTRQPVTPLEYTVRLCLRHVETDNL